MSLRSWARRHPEWWALALSAGAWVLLLRQALGHGGALSASSMMAMPDGTHMKVAMSPSVTFSTFALMVAAMMIPLAIASLRATASRSLWRRRRLAMAEYLAGFLAVWLLAGAALLDVRALADAGLPGLGRSAAPAALALAALWQLTPIKRRALNAHHWTRPLAPVTPRADRDCFLYGGLSASRCMLSCGPLMAAMTLTLHSLGLMVLLTGVVVTERYRFRPPRRSSAALLGVLAVILTAL